MTKSSQEVETIDQLLADPWAVAIQDIWEQAAHNPDPDKRKLFDALHTYVIDKRQERIINEKHFVIYRQVLQLSDFSNGVFRFNNKKAHSEEWTFQKIKTINQHHLTQSQNNNILQGPL
ncbi:hypothetical protein IMAU50151_02057 [Lactobacillus helveticus]|nr:hypothetical protein [Lactobacillus helveticus]